MGTLVSGALYSYVDPVFTTNGMGACFLAGAACSLLATFITYPIRDDSGGIRLCSLTRECILLEFSDL